MLGISPALSVAQAPPATQPAPLIGAGLKMSRVEVFAFTPVNAPADGDWIGRGIQESLQTDVSRTGATLLLPSGAPASGNDAMATAKQNHADLAVIGSYQSAGDDIRVNGHLVDVADGSTVGSFAATGPQKNLFAIEDALGEQLRRLLPASSLAQQTTPAVIPQTSVPAPAVVYEQAPQVSYPPPTINYYDATPTYVPDYGYAYPGYISDYPLGFYGGIGIYSGGYYGHVFNRGFDYGSAGRGGFVGGGRAGTFGGISHGFGGVSHGFGGGGFGGGHAGGGRR
jgi:TolB-like protein